MSEPTPLNGQQVTFAPQVDGRAARTRSRGSLRTRLARFSLTEAHLRRKLLLALTGLDLPGETGALRTRASFAGGSDADIWMLFRSSAGVVALAPRIFDGEQVTWLQAERSPDLPEAISQLAAFEFVIAALERQSGGPLAPVGLGSGPSYRLRLDLFGAPTGAPRHSLSIALDEAAALAWPAVGPAIVAAPDLFQGLRLRCEICVAGPRTPLAELGLLEVSDIILMPSRELGHWPALIKTGPAGPVLSGGFNVARSRFVLRSWKAVHMEDTQAPPLELPGFAPGSYASGPVDETPDQGPPIKVGPKDETAPLLAGLPVQLQMCIGELELSLGELAALAPGAILEIPSEGEDLRVSIMANTVRIAVGRLVALGDGYGVLVESLVGGE